MELQRFRPYILPFVAALNAVALYLFILQLPYALEALRISFAYWGELSPRGEIAAVVGFVAAVAALLLVTRAGDALRARLLYLKGRHSHPGHRIFFGGRDPGFDLKPLYAAYPRVRDSAFNPEVQFEVWSALRAKHAARTLVSRSSGSWELVGDLFLIALWFLLLFLVVWPLNGGIPFPVVTSYLFLFGAQALFLWLLGRSLGERMAANVLAAELGLKVGDELASKKK